MNRQSWLGALQRALVDRGAYRRLRVDRGEVRAAVLLPILANRDNVGLLLVQRSRGLANHAGQIAFPGGAIEADDSGEDAAALREAWEEVALDPQSVEVVGRLQDFRTPTGFVITPVVGVVSGDVRLRAAPHEVELMLLVPLAHALDPRSMRAVTVERRGLLYHGEALVFQDHLIWGATARMLVALRRVLLEVDGPWRVIGARSRGLVDRCGTQVCGSNGLAAS